MLSEGIEVQGAYPELASVRLGPVVCLGFMSHTQEATQRLESSTQAWYQTVLAYQNLNNSSLYPNSKYWANLHKILTTHSLADQTIVLFTPNHDSNCWKAYHMK